MDNQLSTWDNRELRIILSGDENEKSVCTNIDGFI
uniref:DNA-directed RNA polymerase n=1 Tax=Meloidogyne hapla TaxID=6305 RepID=A0A1I8BP18_MELHA